MAILILFLIAFVVAVALYRKGFLRKVSVPQTGVCDKTSGSLTTSAVPKSCRIEFKLFEVRPDVYKDKDVSGLEVKSDKIQNYVEEMIAMYSRRGEWYSVDFLNFNSCVGVVFKHWFDEEDDV